jgi:hypothetical protein
MESHMHLGMGIVLVEGIEKLRKLPRFGLGCEIKSGRFFISRIEKVILVLDFVNYFKYISIIFGL